MIPLIAVVVVLAVALLALGFFAPRLSRRVQGTMDRKAERAESKADTKPQPVRGMAERSLDVSQRIADRATATGRKGRDDAEQTRR